MVRHRLVAFALLMTVGVSLTALAQGRPDPATLIAAQREAMVPLAFMDGVWRGPAWVMVPSGEKHTITQTERIGPFLDGSVKVIEGRGYDPDGIGDRIMPGKEPVRFFEMNLKRVGDTNWPAAGAISPK